jgi:hypothetical protein
VKNLTLIFLCFFFFKSINLSAQEEKKDNLIQFSGKVVTKNSENKITALPYTNVYLKNTSRGTASEIDGFFSIVARTGDTVIFSQIGFETVEYVIPDSLTDNLYYWIQIMSQDDILLPEAIIRPYPSREFFKIELLALDVSKELEKTYEEYLSEELLAEMRINLPADGAEAVNLYLRQTVNNYKYAGQIKPQNVFNPLAWKQFIDAWKRGDFKSKKKKK